MTTFIKTILGAAVALTFGAYSATAATWNCNGPRYACKDTAGVAKTTSKAKRAHAGKTKKHYASRNSTSGSSAGSGMASWYGGKFHGRKTASGERYNQNAMTAAHKTLPFGTRVRVSRGNRSVVVRINDRGPFIKGRVIDLSRAAAAQLGVSGVAPVKLTVLGRG